MPFESKSAVLDELLAEVIDRRGVTPLKLDSNFTSQGHRVISAKVIKDGRIDLTADEPRFVDDRTYARWMKGPLLADDVVMTSEAPLGEVAYIAETRDWCLGQRLFGLRTKKDRMHGRFLYYALRSEGVRHDFLSRATGTTAQGIRQTELLKVLVPEPSLDEQIAIALTLGTLDDKIEINRRMNETLEAIARAIFKSWFVDFDPVRAKASGEPPESICRRLGLTPDLLALFPDRLVESALGKTPEGWEVKPLDGIANYLNGLALQKYPPESDTEWLPVIKIAQLRNGSTVGADRASHKLNPIYVVDDGDVLFSWSGSLEVDVWCGGRGALNQHLFKVTSGSFPKWFFFHWTKEHLAHFRAIAASKAVTMGHIQRKHLTEALCVVPSDTLLQAADTTLAPMLETVIENRRQARTLAATRDTLLPKLLSGEVRVPLEGAA